jgi:hypothetical protein
MQKILLTLALLLVSIVNTYAANVLTHEFVVEPTHAVLADRPELVREVEARNYASAPKEFNYFSGLNLLLATLLVAGLGALQIVRFVRHEEKLQSSDS